MVNRGPDAADLHLLPTLWFRNDWSKWIAESNRASETTLEVHVLSGPSAPADAYAALPRPLVPLWLPSLHFVTPRRPWSRR